MSEQGSVGRGRAGGRGAQLLAALEASRRDAEKLEVWPGYVTAIDEFEDGSMLCCDVSDRFTVLDELVEMRKKGGYFHQTAQDVLIGLSVLTRYDNKMYRIDEILFDKNPQSIFDCQGVPMSYVDYYKRLWNIEIKDKGQPMLLNRLKKKMQGKEDETVLVCLVPELCYLTGLDDRRDVSSLSLSD